MNSCQKFTLYQSTYFIEYFIQGNFKYPRIKKIHQKIERITQFDSKHQNSLCLVITGIVVYKNKLHINLHILFIIYISDNFKNAKVIKIQEVHQKIHAKQVLLFYSNCFTHFNLMRLEKRD